jgi:hypothetical protein
MGFDADAGVAQIDPARIHIAGLDIAMRERVLAVMRAFVERHLADGPISRVCNTELNAARAALNPAVAKAMLDMFAPLHLDGEIGEIASVFPNADIHTTKRMFRIMKRVVAGLSVEASAGLIWLRYTQGRHYSAGGYTTSTNSWMAKAARQATSG